MLTLNFQNLSFPKPIVIIHVLPKNITFQSTRLGVLWFLRLCSLLFSSGVGSLFVCMSIKTCLAGCLGNRNLGKVCWLVFSSFNKLFFTTWEMQLHPLYKCKFHIIIQLASKIRKALLLPTLTPSNRDMKFLIHF